MKKYPLVKNNITKIDLNKVIQYLKQNDPILTQSKNVESFEKNWSNWLGVKYSVFVNSGSSANIMSLAILKELHPRGGEVILPPLTWSSDINAVIYNGFKPVFVDIDFETLSMNSSQIIKACNNKTVAIFMSHIQGFSGLDEKLLKFLKRKKIKLIEDVCESHGAKHKSKKLGNYGIISNFSFYYAHHMSTIEGGMLCTNNKEIYEIARSMRGHGLVREFKSKKRQIKYINKYKNLNKDFIFSYQGYNFRNNEIGGIIGNSQITRLNGNIVKRNKNHLFFLQNINPIYFFTEFKLTGSSNYAFNLILKNKNIIKFKKICSNLEKNGIEFRVGSAGGGNQLRQPYIKKLFPKNHYKKFVNTEHIHSFGMYIGNYPDLKTKDIKFICNIINQSVS